MCTWFSTGCVYVTHRLGWPLGFLPVCLCSEAGAAQRLLLLLCELRGAPVRLQYPGSCRQWLVGQKDGALAGLEDCLGGIPLPALWVMVAAFYMECFGFFWRMFQKGWSVHPAKMEVLPTCKKNALPSVGQALSLADTKPLGYLCFTGCFHAPLDAFTAKSWASPL